MSWDFIYVVRDTFKDREHWGNMYIVGANGSYEWLCYSYELPWQEYKQGHTFEARSVSSKSRIKL